MSENKTIAANDLDRLLASDSSLTKKVTYEEATAKTFGVNDSELGTVYKAYEECTVNQRGTSDFANWMKKDPSLIRKVTFEEVTATTSGVDDSGLENAYHQYQKFKAKRGK